MSGEHHFKIHFQEQSESGMMHQNQNHQHATHQANHHAHQHTHGHHETEKTDEKRSLREILTDASRQIIASAVILAIGFLLLNWSAYTQIAKNKWNEIWGIESENHLNEIVNDNDIVYTQKVLKTSSDPAVQKRQIPDLKLAIAPSDNRIIIPRINQNIPIVRVSSESLIKRDWAALEREMQEALRDGVVHYPGTSLPGQKGNVVITGHSSYFPWDSGRFKDVFALLHEVVLGDKIVVYHEQDKYLYEVDDIKIVLPKDIDVLKQTPDNKLTLITCTPVGTNLKRLIVSAKPLAINDVPIAEDNRLLR